MDITKTYKEMCQKANEIQEAWQPEIGDYIWQTHNVFGKELDKKFFKKSLSEVIILHYKSSVEGFYHACNTEGEERIFNSSEEMHKATSILLPRQDQLQEIARGKTTNHMLLFSFWLTTNDAEKILIHGDKSMEIYWLEFLMGDKYDKVWNYKKKEWDKRN